MVKKFELVVGGNRLARVSIVDGDQDPAVKGDRVVFMRDPMPSRPNCDRCHGQHSIKNPHCTANMAGAVTPARHSSELYSIATGESVATFRVVSVLQAGRVTSLVHIILL
jgi:hypothetical protein